MSRVRELVRRGEAGMSTAEYAIGVCGAGGFAGLLYKLLTSTWGQNVFDAISRKIFSILGL